MAYGKIRKTNETERCYCNHASNILLLSFSPILFIIFNWHAQQRYRHIVSLALSYIFFIVCIEDAIANSRRSRRGPFKTMKFLFSAVANAFPFSYATRDVLLCIYLCWRICDVSTSYDFATKSRTFCSLLGLCATLRCVRVHWARMRAIPSPFVRTEREPRLIE